MLQPGDKLYTKNNNKINMSEFQGDMIESIRGFNGNYRLSSLLLKA